MSAPHNSLRSWAAKRRFTRSAGHARLGAGAVTWRARHRLTPRIPIRRISRSTVHRATCPTPVSGRLGKHAFYARHFPPYPGHFTARARRFETRTGPAWLRARGFETRIAPARTQLPQSGVFRPAGATPVSIRRVASRLWGGLVRGRSCSRAPKRVSVCLRGCARIPAGAG